jgi:GNAT superfamily N-acetyltransferase
VDADPFGTHDFADPGTTGRVQAVNEVIAALTDDLGQEPQWYLHLVAVRPQFREQGYSSALIRPMLARADEENLPCTLITQSLGNVRKYESWGFKVAREMPVPGSHEKFRSMRRD